MVGPVTTRSARVSQRSGFTMVEMLVVITIIAIVASLVLAALNSARQTAKVAKTKSTIVKLNDLIMDQYESYRTRRVPISTSGMNPNSASAARLNAIRDIMRMEMPDRWNDVINAPLCTDGSGNPLLTRPALSQRYLNRYNKTHPPNPTTENASAECLYMTVTTRNPEARELFSESEVGDTDQDGYPEFLDGWGRPIAFIRWPAGFISSLHADDELQTGDPVADHDPFDPLKQDDDAFRLIPLIFSYGPDGKSDINRGASSSGGEFAYTATGDSITSVTLHTTDPDGDGHYIGQPLDGETYLPEPSELDHYDNIHNHRIEGR